MTEGFGMTSWKRQSLLRLGRMSRTLTSRRYFSGENSDNEACKQSITGCIGGRMSSPICLGSKVDGGKTVAL